MELTPPIALVEELAQALAIQLLESLTSTSLPSKESTSLLPDGEMNLRQTTFVWRTSSSQQTRAFRNSILLLIIAPRCLTLPCSTTLLTSKDYSKVSFNQTNKAAIELLILITLPTSSPIPALMDKKLSWSFRNALSSLKALSQAMNKLSLV
jgi:hypothetical protein